MSKVSALTDLLRQVAETTGAVKSEIQDIDAKIHALGEERSELTDSPVGLDDLLDYLGKELDSKGAFYARNVAKVLPTAPLSFGQLERGLASAFPMQSGDIYKTDHTEEALCYLFRDTILDGYRRVLSEAGPWPKSLATADERRKRVAKLDLDIKALRDQRAALVAGLDQTAASR